MKIRMILKKGFQLSVHYAVPTFVVRFSFFLWTFDWHKEPKRTKGNNSLFGNGN